MIITKRHLKHFTVTIFISMVLLLAGCASASKEAKENHDPYEPYNRVMFTFNDKLDKYVLKPVAKVYNKVLPEPINTRLDNFFSNLDGLQTVLNDLLQGNFYQATSDGWRFAINSTIGVAGFFDVATSMGLEHNKEDFGLTLAKWGYKDSNYFILPFFGPRTVRDALALPANYFTLLYTYIDDVALRNTIYGIEIIDNRARLLRFEGVYEEVAIDPYIFMRNAYMQNRKYEIERNEKVNDPYTAQDMQEIQKDYYLDE